VNPEPGTSNVPTRVAKRYYGNASHSLTFALSTSNTSQPLKSTTGHLQRKLTLKALEFTSSRSAAYCILLYFTPSCSLIRRCALRCWTLLPVSPCPSTSHTLIQFFIYEAQALSLFFLLDVGKLPRTSRFGSCKQCHVCFSTSISNMAHRAVAVPPNVRTNYIGIVDSILTESDLSRISEKKIRQGIQAKVEYDITPQKVSFKQVEARRV